MPKNFNYVGTMNRLGRSKNFPKEIELRKTKHLWVARDGRTYRQTDGTTMKNPYTPVELDLNSIHKKTASEIALGPWLKTTTQI